MEDTIETLWDIKVCSLSVYHNKRAQSGGDDIPLNNDWNYCPECGMRIETVN
jgi:hypothetical protein